MNNKGAFSIIAALLVAVVLIAAVTTTYSAIRYSPIQGQPQILTAIDETNIALNQLLGFAVGYYGSVLKVTGNVTYARQLASEYLGEGLTHVGEINPEWGLSLNITDLQLSTNWFTDDSYSQGTMQVAYDLNGIGVTGISYSTSSRLEVQITNNYSSTQAQFKILSDDGEPVVNLGSNNLKFYRYNYGNLTWEYSVPTNIISYGDGTYLVDLPAGVSGNSYMLQVDDTRGISVLASSFNQFTATIVWNPLISSLINLQESTFTLELLQNGTIRWLGQDMQLTTQTLPIPPIPVKAIHINQTVNGLTQEVPFQVEDWASNYQIPQGLTSNTTIFGNRQMIVFLLNCRVSNFTVWWDGSDGATQTSLAFTNRYFNDDNPTASTLSNGLVTLLFGSFNVKSTVVGTTTSSTAYFMRLNQEASTYGAGLSFVIHHGIVRDVVQQEAEWNTGAEGCPNFYSNMVLTFPANVTYYTYYLRTMFIDSTQPRSITDLSPIRLTTSLSSTPMQTENGTLAGFPIVQNGTGTFLNSSSGSWTAHHFSQFISDTGQGAGIMFTDKDNQILYAFDSFPGSSSKGALKTSSGLIELLPVSSGQVQFNYAYDIAWQGAVVTFDNTTPVFSLYNGTTPTGLWILVEYPPILTVTASLQNPLTASVAPSGLLDLGVGQTQSFTASSSGGTGRKSYQWYLDGVVVSGQTASTYTYTAALGSHTIYVRVTDSAPTPTTAQSNTVSTVAAALSVSVTPVGPLTMNAGQAQTFTASVSGGTGTKSYVWYLDGVVVSGQTASTYAYTAATSGSPHSVYCKVTDSATTPVSVNSNTVTVTVNSAMSTPSITPTGPLTMDATQTQTFTLGTVSGGSGSKSYQWYLDGSVVSGQTGTTYTYTAATSGSPHSVYCKVTDSATTPVSVNSNTVTVTVNSAMSTPSITPTGPLTMDATQTQTFTLGTVSGGSGSKSYQWYLDGSVVSGQTGTTYTYTAATSGSPHSVYCKVTDSATTPVSVNSNTVTVTVNSAMSTPSITPTGPLTMDATQTQTFTLGTVSGGSGSKSYQWYLDGSVVSGQTGTTYTYTAATSGSPHSVYCKVTDSATTPVSVNSNTVTVTVNSAMSTPSITPTGPLTMDATQTQTFTLGTVSGGSGSKSYQWYLDGSVVSGQTGTTYTYTAATSGSPHSVYCKVTDSATTPVSVNSNMVSITVNSAPITITLRPNAAGSTTQNQAQGSGSANWDRVDEAATDGTTTYVRGTSDNAWRDDSYNIPDRAITGTITNVRIYIVCQKDDNNENNVQARTVIRLGSGTIEYGAAQELTTGSWTTYSSTYASKSGALGTGSWTWADINNLQIGVSLKSQSQTFGLYWTYAQCTQVWVEITYTP